MNMDEMSQHKEPFLIEARDHVQAMNATLLKLEKLEKRESDIDSLHDLLRATHTLKSMAAAMNYTCMAELCHAMEDLVVAMRAVDIVSEPCVDALFECFDLLDAILREISEDRPELETGRVIEKLHVLIHTIPAQELLEESSLVRENHQAAPLIEHIQTIGVSVGKLDVLLNLTEELLVARMRLDQLEETVANPELSAAIESVGRLITDLQYNVMQARMAPIGFLFSRFRRMIRDLAKHQSKEIDLVLEGSDIELDRAMIDELGECLVHLLRNAVDHGIESPEKREQTGKSRRGSIRLAASSSKESAIVAIEDDGAGLDLEAIRQAGLKHGSLDLNATTEEIIQAIFWGVSTTEAVTPVSGRGMGLNIAKKKIEAIGGTVVVESTPGKGTRFVIEVPLTLAVIKTLFVAVGGKTYAVPVSNIDRLIRVNPSDLKSAFGRGAILLERQEIPITRLDVLFGCVSRLSDRQSIVIVRKGQSRMGLVVDDLLSTEEIVIKPLNRILRENRYFAGSALIGSGEVALVLDIAHLMATVRPSPSSGERDAGFVSSLKEHAAA